MEACMSPTYERLSIVQAKRLLESSFTPYGCRFIPDGPEYFGLEFFSLTDGCVIRVVFGMRTRDCHHAGLLGQLIAELHLELAINRLDILIEQSDAVAA
jgi:hypothetical protein